MPNPGLGETSSLYVLVASLVFSRSSSPADAHRKRHIIQNPLVLAFFLEDYWGPGEGQGVKYLFHLKRQHQNELYFRTRVNEGLVELQQGKYCNSTFI